MFRVSADNIICVLLMPAAQLRISSNILAIHDIPACNKTGAHQPGANGNVLLSGRIYLL
jgi:hypothetical protein